MDITVITGIVNEVGFPIAACIALFYLNRDSTKQYRELMLEFKTAIDRNTNAINRIIDEFEKGN